MEIFLNILIITILLGIAGGIVLYLYKAKKRGQKCIGCPYAKQCAGKCGCGDRKPNGSDTEQK